jgi:uncharacterized protein YndB with AHSA1/START domain
MKSTGNLKLTTQADREIVMTRALDAPRRLVFDAFTKPELVKQWLLGPPGWSMPICEIDRKVGGAYRYVWRRVKWGWAVFIARSQPRSRWSPPRSLNSRGIPVRQLARPSSLGKGGKTTITQMVLYQSQEARDAVLKSGMERGVAASYDRLAELLASLGTPGMGKGASK